MADILTKRFDTVTADDIHELIAEAVQEDQELEFKEALPSNAAADPWYSGASQIGEKSRNELLAEIVAFANAYGGCLVVGMKETADKPPRAAEVRLVPRCAELAERLALQARDCIEPRLPIVHFRGVELEGDGAGVVIARVPTSRMRPHRLLSTRECYVRRHDRCEKMSMREIQDLTLFSHFDSERRDARLIALRDAFRQRVEQLRYDPTRSQVGGLRISAVPIGADIRAETVHNNPDVLPIDSEPVVSIAGTNHRLIHPRISLRYVPALRATRGRSDRQDNFLQKELHTDGTFSVEFIQRESDSRGLRLYADWVVALFISTLETCENFRRHAGAPDVEYAVEVEVTTTDCGLSVYGFNDRELVLGKFEQNATIFPRYSFGPREEWDSLVTLVTRDLWNAVGAVFPTDWQLSLIDEVVG